MQKSQATMSDDEHHDVHFESTDSGASMTFPMQAGNIRKNGFIVIKGRPCKVVDVSTSKTGKHGHAKCNFTALDIFTNKKLEDLQPSSHNCDVPNVTRTEFTLIDISDDGFVSLMTDSGDTKDDLSLPKGTDDLEKLAQQIQADFDEGKEVVVTVLSVRVSVSLDVFFFSDVSVAGGLGGPLVASWWHEQGGPTSTIKFISSLMTAFQPCLSS
jgi:translation initiation factor 5A